jgi:hypothetical protein
LPGGFGAFGGFVLALSLYLSEIGILEIDNYGKMAGTNPPKAPNPPGTASLPGP